MSNHATYTTRQFLHRNCLNVLITLVDFPGEQSEQLVYINGGFIDRSHE